MLSTVRTLISLFLLLLAFSVPAQQGTVSDSAQGQPTAVAFTFEQQRTGEGQVVLRLKARPRPGIKLFALRQGEEDAVYSEVRLDSSLQDLLVGGIIEQGALRQETDPVLEASVRYVTDSLTWQQAIRATTRDSLVVEGAISYMYLQGVHNSLKGTPFIQCKLTPCFLMG